MQRTCAELGNGRSRTRLRPSTPPFGIHDGISSPVHLRGAPSSQRHTLHMRESSQSIKKHIQQHPLCRTTSIQPSHRQFSLGARTGSIGSISDLRGGFCWQLVNRPSNAHGRPGQTASLRRPGHLPILSPSVDGRHHENSNMDRDGNRIRQCPPSRKSQLVVAWVGGGRFLDGSASRPSR